MVCSFGDASANHSTAVGAINTAGLLHLPGPAAAAAAGLRGQRPRHQRAAPRRAGSSRGSPAGRGLRYFHADGADLAGVYDAARAGGRLRPGPAASRRSCTCRTVRFGGHAGSDVEAGYRTPAEIAADFGRDPLLGTARLLVAAGAADRRPRCWTGTSQSRERVCALAERGDQPAAADHAPRRSWRRSRRADPRAGGGQRGRHAPPPVRGRRSTAGCRRTAGPLTLAQTINAHAGRRAGPQPETCSCSARTWAARAACTG